MSNYTKSFNFRNGVQVDDDNFVISPSGLVGIGTTQPSKSLDVFGDTRVSGMSSFNNIDVVGIVTVGPNITIDATTGIISATSFQGNVSGSTGIVAIATAGFVQNVGSLTTDAKVGIKTDSPEFDFQVGSNPKSGVGIGVTKGDIFISGLTTTRNLFVSGVTTFKGGVDGLDLINISGIASLSTLTVSGVSTFSNLIDLNSDLSVIGDSTLNGAIDVNGGANISGGSGLIVSGGASISGASTIFGDFMVIGTTLLANAAIPVGVLQVGGHTELGAGGLTVAGVSTFNSNIFVGSGATVGFGASAFFSDNARASFGDSGDLNIYYDSTKQHSYIQDSGSGDIVILSNQVAIRNAAENEDMARFVQDGSVELYQDNEKRFQTTGLGASVYGQLDVARLNGGASSLSTHFGSLVYGNESGGRPYSTRRSLDLVNEDSGNINFYLNANNIGVNTGDFHWHRGLGGGSQLMTLSYTGNLGIGETQPIEKLHVGGGATFSSGAYFGASLDIKGGISCFDPSGIVSVTANNFYGNIQGDVTGDVSGQVAAPTGISTFNQLKAEVLGVGTAADSNQPFKVNVLSPFVVDADGKIGLGTDVLTAGVDFSKASLTDETKRFMVPPRVSTAERGDLSAMPSGALIFNTTSGRLELYNGTAWVGIATEA